MTEWQVVALLITILGGSFSIIGTILFVGWKLRGYFSELELNMAKDKGEVMTQLAANKEISLALHRRVESLESKLP